MTKNEFEDLLETDREAAIGQLIDRKVDEWMNDGPAEVKRVLTLWAMQPSSRPCLNLGSDGLIVELAEACELIDSESVNR